MRGYLALASLYQITTHRLRGLCELYNTHPDFRKLYTSLQPKLAAFMRKAIEIYCSKLERAQQGCP